MTVAAPEPGAGFTLDRFQREAIAAIDAGHHVLVAAPTGAGKTVVAEHAVARALAAGRRAFYTTPIKALSNQKYSDFVRAYGADRVGLLTGDNAINPDAGVVVMTTEVLRNMVYARAETLAGLAFVVLDEVHYLQDAYRGPVWEEVIVHAPQHIRFVCLSATVSNADELAGWISAARGRTETIVEHERPVELVNHFLVADKASGDLIQVETLVDGRANPEGDRFDARAERLPKHLRYRQRARERYGAPRRTDVVEHLAGSDLLPAIYFIFSRKGCDDAARALAESGLRLTTGDERARIRAIARAHLHRLSAGDLDALDHDRWLAGLEAGIAAHHAGMVPPFKEAVEACFVEGLVKVVFATETMALGINMPARSVVLESLSKFTGEHHEDLTPSQYTQLTGRAGRRGIDPIGHALVLWSPWYGFDKVAALAASREFVLRSAFRPTANMAVNLIRRYDREEAHELLGRSFAQYQADRSVARLAHRRASRAALLAEAEAAAHCERGDVDEYMALVRAERDARRAARAAREGAVDDALDRLQPGDVIRLRGQRLAVVSTTHRKGLCRVKVVDAEANATVLDATDFAHPPVSVAQVPLPDSFDPNQRVLHRQIAAQLRKARLRHRGEDPEPLASEPGEPAGRDPRTLAVADCPDLDDHVAAAIERDRLRSQLADLDRRLHERRSSLGRQFDALLDLLDRWRFVDGWSLTERGEILARTFHESDLLCAAAVADGCFDGLGPSELVAAVSLLTYEHRSKEPPPPPWFPSAALQASAAAVADLARQLRDDEARRGLPATREPDPTFVALAHAWASGTPLEAVLADEDLSGGDFVRNIKTLIDLVRQVADIAPEPATRRAARAGAEALHHGIVAASSEVWAPSPGEASSDGLDGARRTPRAS